MHQTCRVEQCQKPSRAKGLCTMHYQRLRLTGETGLADRERAVSSAGTCGHEDCERGIKARGLCSLHYERAFRDRSVPAQERKYRVRTSDVCIVDGCSKASTASKGLCPMHYYRLRAEGSPGEAEPRRRPSGAGCITERGYVLVPCPEPWKAMADAQGRVYQHRLVLARALGRPLTADETVHHIDGDRQNNSAANLRLFVGNHGSGQSVDERVAAAVGLLKRYAPELLA